MSLWHSDEGYQPIKDDLNFSNPPGNEDGTPILKLYVGDLVEARNNLVLASGCNRYDFAVVTQVEPLILVSEEGDMLWRGMDVDDFTVIGAAEANMLYSCIYRMNSDLQHDAIADKNKELMRQLFMQASENVANNDLEGFSRAVELLVKSRESTK